MLNASSSNPHIAALFQPLPQNVRCRTKLSKVQSVAYTVMFVLIEPPFVNRDAKLKKKKLLANFSC